MHRPKCGQRCALVDLQSTRFAGAGKCSRKLSKLNLAALNGAAFFMPTIKTKPAKPSKKSGLRLLKYVTFDPSVSVFAVLSVSQIPTNNPAPAFAGCVSNYYITYPNPNHSLGCLLYTSGERLKSTSAGQSSAQPRLSLSCSVDSGQPQTPPISRHAQSGS